MRIRPHISCLCCDTAEISHLQDYSTLMTVTEEDVPMAFVVRQEHRRVDGFTSCFPNWISNWRIKQTREKWGLWNRTMTVRIRFSSLFIAFGREVDPRDTREYAVNMNVKGVLRHAEPDSVLFTAFVWDIQKPVVPDTQCTATTNSLEKRL